MAGGRTFDKERLRALILFVAGESESDPRFGATKLNKILYFSDFKAFTILGTSITGATYVRMDRGPVPQEISALLDEMAREGEIEREERWYFNYKQKVVKPRKQSDAPGLLAPRELEIVQAVMEELKHLNASEVSALSHLEVGWQLAEDREEIAYETAYISNRRPTPTELRMWRAEIDERRTHRGR